MDSMFSWKKAFMVCWTGFPNMGKTEIFLQLSLIKAAKSGWKIILFCPENMSVTEDGAVSADEIFDTLIHAYVGKSTDPFYKNNQMSLAEYEKAIEFMQEHFRVVDTDVATVDDVLETFQFCINSGFKADIVCIDPWNNLLHDFVREDSYLSNQFSKVKRFAVKNNVVFNIVAHPKSVNIEEGKPYPICKPYHLSGGAMWNNKMDMILSMHRPNYHSDIADPSCELHSVKIRNRKLNGYPGTCDMSFSPKTNRYYISSQNPLDEKPEPKQIDIYGFKPDQNGLNNFQKDEAPF
jgi:hypothetical protein